MNKYTFIVVVLVCGGLAGGAVADERIERILERVESKGAQVKDLRCDVTFVKDDFLAGDTVKREGQVYFKRDEPNSVFLVTFSKTVQEGAVSQKKRWYVFDGRFLLEANESSKTTIKRDLAPNGEKIDMFSIDSPIVVPFGQKKDEILDNFDVVLEPPQKGDPAETDHLVCTPKPGSRMAREFSRMEFFVSQSLNLPIRITTTANPADSRTMVEFNGLSDDAINTGLDANVFSLPAETRGYVITQE